ncbi:hypothetical protein [Maritalea mediterranea]|uniref:Glycosyltransferase family 92 protein n=1 Tax=Maritalea mediterranea TaxID=2909667 RepID=A0ABS9E361_9HYPH|nr:hypothetical protein [Maritalea mediterranea]MCF4097315.1 hypothetical protein [Maritalea mediterranea]
MAEAKNTVFLPENCKLRRVPMFPDVQRSEQFMSQFDQRGIFYSVFRSADGKGIWFIGPELMSLASHIQEMHVVGRRSRIQKKMCFVKSRAALIGYVSMPADETEVDISLGGIVITAAVGDNYSEKMDASRIVYAINKDNDLDWIADWAKFYSREHGADSIVIFDNGSKTYETADLRRLLASIDGLTNAHVVNWEFVFGALDPVAQSRKTHFSIMFAQPVMHLELYLRYGFHARSILNVDIDELVVSKRSRSIFEVTEKRLFGCVKFERFLVENVIDGDVAFPSFLDFVFRNKENLGRQDRYKKWAFSPKRVKRTSKVALPNTHWVDGVVNPYPTSQEFVCYHFAGITSGWRVRDDVDVSREWQHKRHIAEPYDPNKHVKDEFLASKLQEIFGRDDE